MTEKGNSMGKVGEIKLPAVNNWNKIKNIYDSEVKRRINYIRSKMSKSQNRSFRVPSKIFSSNTSQKEIANESHFES